MADVLDILMFLTAIGVLMAGFPVAFTLAGVALMFAGLGYAFGVFDLRFLGFLPQRIFGNAMTNEVLMAVPLFVFMGVTLERSRVAEELLDTMGKLFGSLRGGLGLSVFVVGALLAASTGIVGATVVTMGLLSLPTMLRRGYDPALSSGAIAASGTLGQIIPPSIVLVILGDQISNAYSEAQRSIGNFAPDPVSVGDLFAGALMPGLMLVVLYMSYVVGVAIFRPEKAPALPLEALGDRKALYRQALRALVPPLVLIVAVLGSILAGVASPTEAAAVGAAGALLLGGSRTKQGGGGKVAFVGLGAVAALLVLTSVADLRVTRTVIPTLDYVWIGLAGVLTAVLFAAMTVSLRRMDRAAVLRPVMRSTMEITAMVFVILIGAALFSLVFRGLGGDEAIHAFLSSLPGGETGALLLVMLVIFVLGFFLDFIEITFVVVPIVAPVLLMMDIDPIWLGVLIAMNLQTSFLTPPFGFALFYLRGVAPKGIVTGQIYRGALPFVAIQLTALAIVWLFPDLALWLPEAVFG